MISTPFWTNSPRLVLVAVQDSGDDCHLKIFGQRLAELRQQLRRCLDPRPVVLVQDEQTRLAACRQGEQGYPEGRPLRILFAAPAWAPSRAFGGPVVAAGELVRRLVARGHVVDVLTTTILDLQRRPSAARSSASGRRRYGPLPRHPAALSLDGNHADAAARTRTNRTGPTSCTCSASAIRSRPVTPRGAGSRACRTCSSRWGCSSRGCGRWC